jgi:hypothetical protein
MWSPAGTITDIDVSLESTEFGGGLVGDEEAVGGAVGGRGEKGRGLERVFGLGLPGWALREEGYMGGD